MEKNITSKKRSGITNPLHQGNPFQQGIANPLQQEPEGEKSSELTNQENIQRYALDRV